MTPPAPGSKTVRFLSLALVVYFIGLIVYSIYSSMTAQGFAGWLIVRQMDWFGSASITLTVCIVMAVFGFASLILAAVAGATVWPAMGDALMSFIQPAPAIKTPRAASSPNIAPPNTGASPRWSTILKTAIVLFGITGALASALYFLNVREQSLGVYRLNLDRDPGPLPGRIGFVRLTGTLARRYVSSYKDNNNIYLVVPVAAAGWTADSPVRYFVHYQQLGTSETAFSLPSEFRQPGPAEFTGRFSGRLPAFVQSALAKKGVKLDPGYKILEWENIGTGKTPRSDTHLVALIVGGIISSALLALMVAMRRQGAKSGK